MPIKSSIAILTPEMAKNFLANNSHNRPITKLRVNSLAEAIRRGEWKLNGESICISETGSLLDGQHRCLAVVQTGQSVETVIVHGLPDTVFTTIDQGARRTIADTLAILGELNYSSLAGVLALVHMYLTKGNPFHGSNNSRPSQEQALSLLKEHPQIRAAVSICKSSPFYKTILPASALGFCHFAFHRDNPPKAEEFFNLFGSGIGLTEGSPVLLLRERLMMEVNAPIVKATTKYKTGLCFKAFRAFKSGQKMKTLRIRTEGPDAEKDWWKL